jgi:uncharacterized protein DUF3168
VIEQGLVRLLQGNAGVAAIVGTKGGYFADLPKDAVLPSWTYAFVSTIPEVTLAGAGKLARGRLQIDCYGTSAQAIGLAAAINSLLNGFRGTLTDPDSTRVQGCFQSNAIDFFDSDSRTYRRMLEYQLWFGS